MRILITGLMGSGKTTHAKKLAKILGLCFLKSGDILRKQAKVDDKLGRICKQAIQTGAMIDDGIMADFIKKQISQSKCKRGFVSDSYPRHVGQLDYFDPDLDIIFYLDIPFSQAKKRLLVRGRVDDTKKLIDYRHKKQRKGIQKLVKFYKNKIPVIKINARNSIDKVHKEILSHFNETKK